MEELFRMSAEIGEVRYFQVGQLKLEIHPNRKSMGAAAAVAAAEALKELGQSHETIAAIFATGASQLDTLDALTSIAGLPWNRVRGFHLDEYVGLPVDHPASFRGYLKKNLTQKVQMKEFLEVDGTASDPEQVCRSYADALRSADPQLCLLGIGENGHLAFNDPDIADFHDPKDVKVVHLDAACRIQQAAEGWFNTPDDVPDYAITLTIPTVFRVPKLIVSVPGSRKAAIMRRTLEDAISTECPATILRTHPDVTVYLDEDSAAHLDGLIASS
jgi:glucosamine-6-phosphate deaminase